MNAEFRMMNVNHNAFLNMSEEDNRKTGSR
jgi:hypothetical protein